MGAALGAKQIVVEELMDRNLEPEEKIECMSMTAVCITDLVEHELREHELELCGGREEEGREEKGIRK